MRDILRATFIYLITCNFTILNVTLSVILRDKFPDGGTEHEVKLFELRGGLAGKAVNCLI